MKDVKLKDSYSLFVNGEWREAEDDGRIDVTSPINGEKLTEIAAATKNDVDQAVQEAWVAFESWSKTTPAERAAVLNQIADIIDENAELLATVETMDNGKPIRETMGVDIPYSADHFRYFAGAIRADEGSATMLDENTLSMVLHEPVGVVGQIVPWNFPFLMGAWKLAPVLASGCCTIFKPSSHTSLSVLLFAELIQDVLPPGVFNVLTGAGSTTGSYVLENERLSKLAFTGSTSVGRSVALAAADRLIPATLELGGKSANIFFDDCDMDLAMDNLQMGILFNQGQVCSAGSRVFVQKGILDEFMERAVTSFKEVVVGDPLQMDTQMGTLIYERHLEDVLEYVEIGKKEGARVLCGGEKLQVEGLENGLFMQPTLLADVDNSMTVAQEEIFGPVAVIIPFEDEEDVIRMANDSVYGLAGGVHTKNISVALRVARGIKTGRVWVNSYNAIPAGAPFGGYKESGIGRETHKVMLGHYTQQKSIMVDLSDQPTGFYP